MTTMGVHVHLTPKDLSAIVGFLILPGWLALRPAADAAGFAAAPDSCSPLVSACLFSWGRPWTKAFAAAAPLAAKRLKILLAAMARAPAALFVEEDPIVRAWYSRGRAREPTAMALGSSFVAKALRHTPKNLRPSTARARLGSASRPDATAVMAEDVASAAAGAKQATNRATQSESARLCATSLFQIWSTRHRSFGGDWGPRHSWNRPVARSRPEIGLPAADPGGKSTLQICWTIERHRVAVTAAFSVYVECRLLSRTFSTKEWAKLRPHEAAPSELEDAPSASLTSLRHLRRMPAKHLLAASLVVSLNTKWAF
mmetsp:Transcript_10084/g.34831  ORF Transcript_10084/g.34831 Transcript_10084/m.34831 type:complete len:314 (+) Transcript_10084:3013-3954(+)